MAFWFIQWISSAHENFGRVTDLPPYVLRARQPDKKALQEYIKEFGLKAVLNLRDDSSVKESRKVAEALGLEWYNIDMSDKNTPIRSQVEDSLDLIAKSVETGKTILVHCKGGRHRTGLIIAAFRVRYNKWSKERAWVEADKFGFYSKFGHGPLKEWFFKEF